jgi:hypothetical protein
MDESDAAGSPCGRLASDNTHLSDVLPGRKHVVDFSSNSLETGFGQAGLTSRNQSAFSGSIHIRRARAYRLYVYPPGHRSAVRLNEMGFVVPGLPGFGHGSGRWHAMAVSHCAQLAGGPPASARTEDPGNRQFKGGVGSNLRLATRIPDREPGDICCPTLWLAGSKNTSAMSGIREYEAMLKGSNIQVQTVEDLDHLQELTEIDKVPYNCKMNDTQIGSDLEEDWNWEQFKLSDLKALGPGGIPATIHPYGSLIEKRCCLQHQHNNLACFN